jgi:membrane-bound lytic murein transglycosylase B
MPSSYLQFAEDYDGDGRRDIASTPADLRVHRQLSEGHGWTAGEPWGRERCRRSVRTIAADVPRGNGTCQARRDMSTSPAPRKWDRLGVRSLGGRRLPKRDIGAALVRARRVTFSVSNYRRSSPTTARTRMRLASGSSDQLRKP